MDGCNTHSTAILIFSISKYLQYYVQGVYICSTFKSIAPISAGHNPEIHQNLTCHTAKYQTQKSTSVRPKQTQHICFGHWTLGVTGPWGLNSSVQETCSHHCCGYWNVSLDTHCISLAFSKGSFNAIKQLVLLNRIDVFWCILRGQIM